MHIKTVIGAFAALALVAAPALVAGPARAQDYKLGSLEIHNPTARATPPGAPVAGGYMTITNSGTEADRLVGGSADFAKKVEVHEMKMEGQTMIMRPVEGGLVIPAGGTVVLKPGGYHVMFMGIDSQFKAGEKRAATLKFEKAGEIKVDFDVKAMGAGMKMDKSN